MKVTVAVLNKDGKNAVDKVLDTLKLLGSEAPAHFGLVSPRKSLLDKNVDIIRKQAPESSAVAGYVSTRTKVASGYEFLQLEDTALMFEGRIYSPASKAAAMQQLAKEPTHCETILQTLVADADGDYQLMMLKDGWIAAARDPVGVQPLYFGETREIAALATNRKALWMLGIESPRSFPPGNLGFASKAGFNFKPIKTLSFGAPTSLPLEEAAKQLQALIEESIRRRTCGVKEAAVAFSGGLDSSLIAYLSSRQGVKVRLVHVSMENEAETEEAILAAEALDLPLQVHLYKDSDVEITLPKVIALLEEPDPVKASVGLPFYWTAEKAAEAGLHVMLAGQGADELFGGYQRYVTQYCREGDEKVREAMFRDVVGIHESNLERDLKITSYHDVELRLPFAWFDIAEFALKLPLECKIEPKADTLRKLVLRKAALNTGMPKMLVDKPKKAVQYSTGINDAIKRAAKRHGLTVNEYVDTLFQTAKQ